MTTATENTGVSFYEGLWRTTKEVNSNFRIKVNGMTENGKVNKLVGISGLIELIGLELTNKLIERAFLGFGDKTECKLRRGIKITFYVK